MKGATVVLAAWAVLELAAPPTSRAHAPGLSSTIVEVGGARVEAVMSFNDADLPAGAPIAVQGVLKLEADGRDVAPASVERVALDESHSELRVSFAIDAARSLRIAVPLLSELPFGHKHYLEVRRGAALVTAHVLSARSAPVAVELGSSPGAAAKRDVGNYDRMLAAAVLMMGVAVWAVRRPEPIRET